MAIPTRKVPSMAVAATVLALLLAGCSASNDAGGQSAAGDGALAYNGATTGSHSSTVTCGGSATLHWSGNLGSGLADIRVLDADGDQRISILYSRSAPEQDSKPATGAPGTWTLQVERRADAATNTWSGQYAVHLEC